MPPYNKYKYLLSVVDIGNNDVDFEPIRNKTPETVLKAFMKIIERKHINKPFASITTDSGSEFKGVFSKFFRDNQILHKIQKARRHNKTANVESLNKTLGDLIMNYLNIDIKRKGSVEKASKNWIKILPLLREELNKIRDTWEEPDLSLENYYDLEAIFKKPKFKIGDRVHLQLFKPKNILGEKLTGEKHRMGDLAFEREPREILDIYYYEGVNAHRYKLSGLEKHSFSQHELRKVKR